MFKKNPLFISLSIMSVFFFLCSNDTTSPYNPGNSQAFLSFKDSQGHISATLSVRGTVADTISIGVSTYLYSYIDSITITVKHDLVIDSQVTLRKFTSDIDTIWLHYIFSKTGIYVVNAVAFYQGRKPEEINGDITITGKQIAAVISPKTAKIRADSSVTFVANATGTGPFTYHWYHNDMGILVGGNEQAYVIKPVTLADSGKYKCRVMDQWGDSAFSDTAILAVTEKPKVNTKPTLSVKGNTKIRPAETCTLAVSVTDPDSGQKDSISVVKAPDGYLFKDSTFRWTPSSSYLGTDTLKTDSVIFAVIDNGTPALRDTLTAYIKVYVQAAVIKFNVTYDDNGSTGGMIPVDSNAYTQGARVTVKGNTGTLVKAGYTFTDWNTAADGKGTSYAESNTFSIGSSDVVLYAQWTIALSSSKFLTSFGFTSPPVTGTVNEATKTVAVTVPNGTNVTALVADFASTGTSVKVGTIVQVSGATANNFTTPVTYTVTAEDGSMQNYTVTVSVALNTAKAITAFSFSSPSATGTIDETAMAISLSVPYGTNVTALVATFSTNGAAVKVGSAVQVSGTTANNFSNPVTYTVTAADATTQNYLVTVTVTPPYDYTVTFDAQGATNPAPIHVIQPATNVGTLPVVPANTGYRFDGWFTSQGAQFFASTPVTASLAVYAKWTQVFTVTYDGNINASGTVPVDVNTYTNGTIVTALDNTGSLIKTGYTFSGWNTNSTGTGTERAPGATFAIGSMNVVLYAKWTINKYTVKFNSNGGSVVDSQVVDYRTLATEPAAPTKTSYVFAGWYSDQGLTTAFSFSTVITASITLYAKWEIRDVDGNLYTEVKIGNQVWMVQNLRTTRYRDLTMVPLVTDSATWRVTNGPEFCWYKNDSSSYKNPYGGIYNWLAVNTGKLAPTGWHVPSNDEWMILFNSLGGHDQTASDQLREVGTAHWPSPNAGATNSTGFTGVQGTMRVDNGSFYPMGDLAAWWSSTKEGTGAAWFSDITMTYTDNYFASEIQGFNIRCVRDY